MKKISKITSKQLDKYFLAIAVFGIIGSVTVFRSYAKSNYYDIQQPGRYNIGEALGIDLNAYYLDKGEELNIKTIINSNLTYCLYGSSKEEAKVTFSFGNITKENNFTNNGDKVSKIICIEPETSENKGEFTVKSSSGLFIYNIQVN